MMPFGMCSFLLYLFTPTHFINLMISFELFFKNLGSAPDINYSSCLKKFAP